MSCLSPASVVAVGWPLLALISKAVVQDEDCMVPYSLNPQGDAGTGLSHPWHLLPGMVVLWGKQPGSKALGQLEVWWDLGRGARGRGWRSWQNRFTAESALVPLWLWEGCETPAPGLGLQGRAVAPGASPEPPRSTMGAGMA